MSIAPDPQILDDARRVVPLRLNQLLQQMIAALNSGTGVLDPIAATASQGAILVRGAAGWEVLAAGTAGYVLQTNGAGANPTWVAPSAGASTSTWNPSDKGAGITLSAANRSASSSASAAGVRGTLGRNVATDHAIFEVTMGGVDGNYLIGIGDALAGISLFPGADAHGWSMYGTNGQKNTAGAGVAYGATFTVGDVITVEINAGSLTFWKNGVGQGVAYTGLTGTVYPMAGAGTSGGGPRIGTLNTGSSPFVATVAGAVAWG